MTYGYLPLKQITGCTLILYSLFQFIGFKRLRPIIVELAKDGGRSMRVFQYTRKDRLITVVEEHDWHLPNKLTGRLTITVNIADDLMQEIEDKAAKVKHYPKLRRFKQGLSQ